MRFQFLWAPIFHDHFLERNRKRKEIQNKENKQEYMYRTCHMLHQMELSRGVEPSREATSARDINGKDCGQSQEFSFGIINVHTPYS